MTTVHKYPLRVVDTQTIRSPERYRALHVAHQPTPAGEILTLWMLVDDDAPLTDVDVVVTGTGNPLPVFWETAEKSYVGTSRDPLLGLVWHVFVDRMQEPF